MGTKRPNVVLLISCRPYKGIKHQPCMQEVQLVRAVQVWEEMRAQMINSVILSKLIKASLHFVYVRSFAAGNSRLPQDEPDPGASQSLDTEAKT